MKMATSTKTNLVIVESAAKSKTIAKYLNSSKELKSFGKFQVVASYGHVRDLKKKELGIDVDRDFKPTYEVIQDKMKLVSELQEKTSNADQIFLAADPDREGESIAFHLKQVLKLKDYKRVTFTEITQKALEKAFSNTRKINDDLVDAQETRRFLDRLVGFKLSPLLWKTFTTGNTTTLSAGRVQSAVLHMMIEKEKSIQDFETSPYWSFQGDFQLDKEVLSESKLYSKGTIHKVDTDVKQAEAFMKKYISGKFSINNVKTKTSKQNPDLPYITSSLQQDAYSKLGMPLKRSMQLAQELYEAGYITYMRTDSYSMSDDFKALAQKYIVDKWGEDYYGGGVGGKKAKAVKGAQEAHECIRITNPEVLGDTIAKEMGKDQRELYELIWKRTLASLMKAATFDELEIYIVDEKMVGKDMHFLSSFKKVKFLGFLIVYGNNSKGTDFTKLITMLDKGTYKLQCSQVVARNTWTSPPQRFSESSMVKVLEAEGLGRPSTYSAILSKLTERKYILKSNIEGEKRDVTHLQYNPSSKVIKSLKDQTTVGDEKSKLVPTEIGIQVDKFLSQHFDYIVDKQFTAHMEGDLDRIAKGEVSKLDILNMFWGRFSVDINKVAGVKATKVVLKAESNELTVDGKKYIVRLAKYGPVIQYDDKKYINLKPYLTLVKKQYTDIDDNDIRFLLNMPRDLCEVDGVSVKLMYGPYGLYMKYADANVPLTKKAAYTIIKGEQLDKKDIVKMIEYKANKKQDK